MTSAARRQGLDTRRLITAALFVLLFAMAVRIPLDTDTWWHLRAGDWMFTQRAVLQTDLFSHTRFNEPWVNHSWGAQLVMTALYHLTGGANGGAWGLAFYMALLATGGMVFAWLCCEGDAFTRAFVIVLAATAAAVFWSPRPQMTSFLLSAVLLYLLHLFKRGGLNRVWLIPPLMVLWVNLHGGFSIGFIVLFGFIAGEVLGRLFDGANPDVLPWRKIGLVALVTAVSGAVLVLNPNTVQMWGYPFRTFGIGALQDFIQEWASPNFHGRETWGFVALLLGTLFLVGTSGKRADYTDLALVCGTAFMSLYAGRNIATFALVAAPVFSRHLAAWLANHGWRPARPRPARGGIAVINTILLVVIIAGAAFKIAVTLDSRSVAQAQAEYLPVEAARYLNTARPTGKLFNSYNWGGYLMFAAPDFPVFVDGRTDLYDDALLREWLAAANGREWQATFAKWDIGLVVIERDSGLALALRSDPAWREVYTDTMAAIFVPGGEELSGN